MYVILGNIIIKFYASKYWEAIIFSRYFKYN